MFLEKVGREMQETQELVVREIQEMLELAVVPEVAEVREVQYSVAVILGIPVDQLLVAEMVGPVEQREMDMDIPNQVIQVVLEMLEILEHLVL
jgi:hypothetical protein